MGRRTTFIGALIKAQARSAREAQARRRADAAHARQVEQARAAAARADAAEARAAEAFEKARAAAEIRDAKAQERAEKQAERDRARAAKEADQQAQTELAEEAERKTIEARDTVEELQSLLAHTLDVDDRIEFSSLLVTDVLPSPSLPRLVLPTYVPPPLKEPAAPRPLADWIASKVPARTFIERLFGLTKRYARDVERETAAHASEMQAHEREVAQIRSALAAHKDEFAHRLVTLRKEHEAEVARLKTEHEAASAALDRKREQRAAEVDALERGYRAGDLTCVELYNQMVLERSDYPAGFPQQFRLVYQPESKQLVVDYELPTPDIIPAVAEFKYVKSRRTVEEKPRKPAEVKSIYREVVAQTALRTLHEVLEADQGGHLDTVVFSGYVNRIDETTGQDVRPYLVSVRTTREAFAAINLARVEPQLCLKNLGAQVSASPEEARAVKPIVEFDMVDPRFVEQKDMLGALDSRPNLMDLTPAEFEALVSNMFAKMGLETKLTRSTKDGGVDAVAFDTRPILGGKVVIQAKRYRHTVGVSAVRDLYGTMMNEGASKGIIVATSGYGPDAYKFANDKPLELIDGGGLLYLLEDIGRPARIVMPIEA